MNPETGDNKKKVPQKITISHYRDGKSKVEGLRPDQILIKKDDGTFCIFIKRSKYF